MCRVIWGFEALDSMEKMKVDAKNRSIAPIKIEAVVIHANPFADAEK